MATNLYKNREISHRQDEGFVFLCFHLTGVEEVLNHPVIAEKPTESFGCLVHSA